MKIWIEHNGKPQKCSVCGGKIRVHIVWIEGKPYGLTCGRRTIEGTVNPKERS